MQKQISAFLKMAVTLIGLGIVLSQVHPREIGQTLAQARLVWVLVGLVLVIASLVVRAYRWQLLLQGLGRTIPLGRLVELYFVGGFFTIVLPSGFGGDVVRALEVARDVEPPVAAGTVVLDRLTGLVVLFLMALVILPFRPAWFPAVLVWVILAGSAVGLLSGVLLLETGIINRLGWWLPGRFSPIGNGSLAQLLKAVQGCGWRAVLGASAVSLLFNLILAAWWYTNGLALGLDVPFSYYILVMPLLSVPLLIPSIGGLGPTELLAPTLFGVVGVMPETAVSLSLLNFILQRAAGLLGAPVYIASVIRSNQFKNPHRETSSQR